MPRLRTPPFVIKFYAQGASTTRNEQQGLLRLDAKEGQPLPIARQHEFGLVLVLNSVFPPCGTADNNGFGNT